MALVKARPRWATRIPEMDRLFGDFFRDAVGWVPEQPTFDVGWEPALDFVENDKEYIVKLDAPGIPKENLDVTFENNMLTLSGRREARKDEETEKYIYREREEGRFVRTLRLPTHVMGDKISATNENGILTVKLPKAVATQASKVVIK